MIIILFFIFSWYFSLFFQTFFLHRYAAHKTFSMSRTTEKVFFILTWIGQGSSYLSPYAYGVLHRMHHAYADTEHDPHSPIYDKNLFYMMFRTKKIFTDILYSRTPVEARFTRGVPEWKKFDLFASSWPSRLMWGIIYLIIYLLFADNIWLWLLFPIQCLMAPVHGVIINWFAHKYGYRNFEVSDTSKNLLPVDFLMMGESYHNNHHSQGHKPNFGVKWWEIDPTFIIIKMLDRLKIIKLRKSAI
ncbi:acyl-CoA desaturase [Persicobacter diffluens]|uniref:Fatty acid desaturase n=1 Tax=Persicobacter diffluens TaxID=981 RepID=A0AAN5AK57_9BACT|nr:fatty acid desaturase [Persicobacter diffluens]